VNIEKPELFAPLVGEVLIGDRHNQSDPFVRFYGARRRVDCSNGFTSSGGELENSVISVCTPRTESFKLMRPHLERGPVNRRRHDRLGGQLARSLAYEGPHPFSFVVYARRIWEAIHHEAKPLLNSFGNIADDR
jgi:hypothetical protein